MLSNDHKYPSVWDLMILSLHIFSDDHKQRINLNISDRCGRCDMPQIKCPRLTWRRFYGGLIYSL